MAVPSEKYPNKDQTQDTPIEGPAPNLGECPQCHEPKLAHRVRLADIMTGKGM